MGRRIALFVLVSCRVRRSETPPRTLRGSDEMVFWVFVALMHHFRALFSPGLPAYNEALRVFNLALAAMHPALFQHLEVRPCVPWVCAVCVCVCVPWVCAVRGVRRVHVYVGCLLFVANVAL